MRIRVLVGAAAYRLVAITLRWGGRGVALLARQRPRSRPGPAAATAHVTFRVRRASDLSPWVRARVWLWLARVHGWETRWAAFDWYVTAEIGRRPVSIAGIVDRWGTIGGVPAHLGLLGGVLTVPEHRGRGLAGEAIRRSTELLANELRCDFGVLMCRRDLVHFYERLGWKLVPNGMAFVRFGEPGIYGGSIMVYECAGRPFPGGTIDVKGLPA